MARTTPVPLTTETSCSVEGPPIKTKTRKRGIFNSFRNYTRNVDILLAKNRFAFIFYVFYKWYGKDDQGIDGCRF